MASTAFALDTKKNDGELPYVAWLRDALGAGRSLTGVVREVAKLSWGPGRLQPNEYFLYQLYDQLYDDNGAVMTIAPVAAYDSPYSRMLFRIIQVRDLTWAGTDIGFTRRHDAT